MENEKTRKNADFIDGVLVGSGVTIVIASAVFGVMRRRTIAIAEGEMAKLVLAQMLSIPRR